LWWLAGLLLAHLCAAAAPAGKRELAIAQKALPVLRDECFACHSPEKKKGGLLLTSRDAILQGGAEGPVAVPGKPDASKLLTSLAKEADPHMPPKKQLADAQVKLLRDWVKAGLPWDDAALSDEGPPPPPVALGELPSGFHPAAALNFSPDGRWLAIGQGGTLALHDRSATNAVPAVAAAHRDTVDALAWSPDGQRLVTAGFRRVSLWQTAPLRRERDWTNGLVGRVSSVAFSPDGRRVAVGDGEAGRSGFVRVFALDSDERIASWRAHADSIFGLQFSADGKRLVTAGGDRLVRVWETDSHREIATLEGHSAQVLAVAFNTNATQVVSGGADKQLKVWDIATREKLVTLGNHAAAINAVVWSTEANAIFAATDAGGVYRYTNLKPHTGEQSSATADERHLATVPDAAYSLAVTADGKQLAVGRHDGAVQVFDGEGKELKTVLPSDEASDRLAADGTKPALTPALSPEERGKVTTPGDSTRRDFRFSRSPNSPRQSESGGNQNVAGASLSLGERAGVRAGSLNPRTTPPSSRQALSEDTASAGQLPALPKQATFTALVAEPKVLSLSADSPRTRILLTATTPDGFEHDVTDLAKLAAGKKAPFALTDDREIVPQAVGTGSIRATFGKLSVEIPVTVAAAVSPKRDALNEAPGVAPLSFGRDVLPVLARAGCAAGACHAKAEGQNGFKLSVFSYDPKHDYAEIVKDARGRRVFPAAPDESLVLRKPLGLVPHEGGKRFELGSETHLTLRRWIREGMAFAQTNEPTLERLAVFPAERRYRRGAMQRLRLEAIYSDGSIRDVTRLAAFESNDKEIAQVDEAARVTVGKITGQGVIVARYMGLVAAARVVVPAERTLPAEQFASLPRNNFIDELAYAQFQRLGLLPSELCSDVEFLRRASLDALGVLPTPEEVRAVLAWNGARGGPVENRADAPALTPALSPGERGKVTAPDGSTRSVLRFSPTPGSPRQLEAGKSFDAAGYSLSSGERAGVRAGSPSEALESEVQARRLALIDQLLARPEFADYWANKWADLLRPNPDRVGVKSVLTLDEWLRASFRADKPYDQFVREILLTEGSNHRDGPAVVYRDRREPPELTTMFSQLFLGTRLECAKCHHHPNEKWSQDDFYQFAAFFGPVKQKGAGLSPPISAGRETFYFAPGGNVKHPVTGEVMPPKAPDGPVFRPAAGEDPRAQLADWLTATNNPFFARAAVNRVWATFFGRGLVEPVDDFRVSNPCVNDPLLDALAADFATHGYRLKHLVRTLLASRLYQLSSTPNDSNLADTKNFSRAYRRRLPAEVLLDAVNDATGVPDTFAATAPGTRAMQTWSYKIDSAFMDAFSRPNPSSDPPCERDRQMSVVQSLHLMNAQNLQGKLAHPESRVRRLAEGKLPPAEVVTELYLTTLGRPPAAEELQVAVAAFTAPDATRQTATEDVFWALLNSPEFVFNH
jgi:WD40 repeat protein